MNAFNKGNFELKYKLQDQNGPLVSRKAKSEKKIGESKEKFC